MAAQADIVPLLIHGFLDKGAIWRALTGHLGVLAGRALAPDSAGAGMRAAAEGPFTLRRQATEAIALIDERPEARFLVVGHSMGGQVAELAAQARPDREAALVLMTAVPLAGLNMPPESRTLLRGSGGNAETQRGIRRSLSRHLSEADLALLLDPGTLMGAAATEGYYDAFTAGDESGTGRSTYPGPVLLLAARQDPVISMEMTGSMRSSRFPDSDFAIVEESGHWPHLEQPQQSAEAILRFASAEGLS